MTTASTQLRALEGEIGSMTFTHWAAHSFNVAKNLLTIAKELEAERDTAEEARVDIGKRHDDLSDELSACREALKLHDEDEETNIPAAIAAIRQNNSHLNAENIRLTTENATLKRRLDEAMKELLMVKVGFEITGPNKAVEYIDHRITEIDKL